MKISMPGLFLLFLFPVSIHAVSDYARNCENVIGVPVPDVDCNNPGGSEVSVGTVENGRCDNPSHGMSECNPGTKFIKYTDRFERDGKTETVTTMIMCRKTNGDVRRPGGATDDIFSDIGVIQYNETKHATCWFSSTSEGQQPTVRKGTRMSYPSPSTENNPGFWGDHQPEARCINCHQSGVWLRSPFAMGLGAEQGKGFQRTGRGAYQPGDGNNIPDNSELVSKRGLSCSVGRPDWNTGDGRNAPKQVRIVAEAYDRKFPPRQPANGNMASSGTCTNCHYLGMGSGNQFCGAFLNELKGGGNQRRRAAAPFASHFWMPPGAGGTDSREAFMGTFGRALEAAEWCCQNPIDRDFRNICEGPRFSRRPQPGPRGEEGRVLQALAEGGSCALCPNCVANGGGQPAQGRKSH